jgi:hypothetical protein
MNFAYPGLYPSERVFSSAFLVLLIFRRNHQIQQSHRRQLLTVALNERLLALGAVDKAWFGWVPVASDGVVISCRGVVVAVDAGGGGCERAGGRGAA